MLKVKWLAHMILAFFSPMFVFLLNTTPHYYILRFNGDPLIIALLLIATLIHFWFSSFPHQTKIDLTATNLGREKPAYFILGVCFVSYLLLNTSEGWIS